MTEMVPTHNIQWKNIQSFDRLSDILRGNLGSNSVADIVTAMSNVINTEIAAAYEETRKVYKVVEGATTKVEYHDGIGFLNTKGNTMTEFKKAAENQQEDIMYLKVLCNLYRTDIDERILQDSFKFHFCLNLLQSIWFPNGDIRNTAGRPGKGKRKKKAVG